MSRFMHPTELHTRLNGELKHLLITGNTGVGKTQLAKSFAEMFSNDIDYYGIEQPSTESELIRELELLRELAETRNGRNEKHEVKVVIIDEAFRYADVLASEEGAKEDFARILELGERVGIFIILITQREVDISIIEKEVLDNLTRVHLDRKEMMKGRYEHYKGGEYNVIGIGKHTESGGSLVIYTDEKGDLYARPLEIFEGVVEIFGEKVPRFRKI